MKKIISDYIINAEELLLIYPNNKLIRSYLVKLKSLKNVPDIYLREFDKVIPVVYEALKEIENEIQNKVIIKIFSTMIEAVKLSVQAEKIKADYPDFDHSFFNIKKVQ